MAEDRPAAEAVRPGHFPGPPVEAGHVAPCPRRLRALRAATPVLDTTSAFYVWEHPYYPQYAVPRLDASPDLLAHARDTPPDPRLGDHAVVHFDAADVWFEEDERVFGHPRSPYVRVDAIRSTRRVRVVARPAGLPPRELAVSDAPVAVFETGLPVRWYLDPTCVDWAQLATTDTRTLCPYKGVADEHWAVGDLGDVAWSYRYPRPGLEAIAGLVAFDDAQVDIEVATTHDRHH